MLTLNVYDHSLPGESGFHIAGSSKGRVYTPEPLEIRNNYTDKLFIEFNADLEYQKLVLSNGRTVHYRPLGMRRVNSHLFNSELAVFVEAGFGTTIGGWIGIDGCLYEGLMRYPTVTHSLFTREIAEIVAGYPGTEYIYGYDEDNQTLTRYV